MMMMAGPTSLNDILVNRFGDASYSKLDHLVDTHHQNKIAMSITDWRSIAPFLGLGETDEEDIETQYSTRKTRNIAMLRKWNSVHILNATYRKLLEAFWDVERVDLIDKLLQMVAVDNLSSQVMPHKAKKLEDESVIFVKTLSGQCINLEVISTDTVEDLKMMLRTKLPVEERVETKKMRLIFQGQELSDERLLTEYAIENHSTVYQRLLTGTIQLCISLPEFDKSLPLTVKPATTFTDIVDRVVAMERTLLPYQHLVVALLGRSSVQLSADKYTSSVGDYDLKGEDTVELAACKRYCHTIRVTVSSDTEFPPSRVTVLKLHSSNTFRTVEKLVLEGQRDVSASIHACASGMVLEPERLVGTISECFASIVIERARVVHHYASYSGSADRTSVMGVRRTRGTKTALSLP